MGVAHLHRYAPPTCLGAVNNAITSLQQKPYNWQQLHVLFEVCTVAMERVVYKKNVFGMNSVSCFQPVFYGMTTVTVMFPASGLLNSMHVHNACYSHALCSGF